MGEFGDYLEEKRQNAMSEMEEILAELDGLKNELQSAYNIGSERFEIITELVIDKGLEIIQNYESTQSLNDSCETMYSELEALRNKKAETTNIKL